MWDFVGKTRKISRELRRGYVDFRYDCSSALFVDPLGFDAGDTNLYRYVNNRPTWATDPSGLERSFETRLFFGDSVIEHKATSNEDKAIFFLQVFTENVRVVLKKNGEAQAFVDDNLVPQMGLTSKGGTSSWAKIRGRVSLRR